MQNARQTIEKEYSKEAQARYLEQLIQENSENENNSIVLYDRISLSQSQPFLFSRHKDLFTFTNKPDYCIKKDKIGFFFWIDGS